MAEEKNNQNAADTKDSAPKGNAKETGAPNQKVESAGPVKEFYEEKGAESASNLMKGGKAVVVNLTNKTLVEFTKDYKGIKKGHSQEVSDVAFAIYDKAGVIKKL